MKEWIAGADAPKEDSTSERMFSSATLFRMLYRMLYRMDDSKWSFQKMYITLTINSMLQIDPLNSSCS